MKNIKLYLLTIIFIFISYLTAFANDEVYNLNYVLQLRGGFPYTIEEYAKEQNMTLEHFLYLENVKS